MAWYPKAIRKPITAKNRARMRWYNRVNLHVAVSEAPSLFGYFNQKGIPDSHFYVRKDGTIEQYVDTDYQAYADLEGNDATISIETQGGLHNTQTEKWTAAQVESLAQIYAWAVETHGIPLKMAKDSIPTGTSSHGLSWHRLGIDGNFPDGILHGRVPGGMHYSRSRGKVCPGNAKIKQIPTIYDRAVELLGGTNQEDWLTMATKQDVIDAAEAGAWQALNRQIAVGGATGARHGGSAPFYALARDAAYGYDAGRNGRAEILTRLAAIEANISGTISAEDVAAQVAGLLLPDLAQTITDAIDETPDRNADQIAQAVVDQIGARLNPTTTDPVTEG